MTQRRHGSIGLWLAGLALGLAACAEREEILPGTRVDLRAVPDAVVLPTDPVPVSVPIRLPALVVNADWTHPGGSAQHVGPHAALGQALAPVWTVGIGQGEDRRHRITADPVVSGARIFTLDSRATVAATAASGAPLWSRDLTPAGEFADEASGGGLAIGGGRLFATTGFGELVALDPLTGAVQWRQAFEAPVASAPTEADGIVYVVAEDSSSWAIAADTGRVIWQAPGTPTLSAVVGGGGPAVSDRMAILPFPSGEIQGVLRDSGLRIWTGFVGGQRPGQADAGMPDLTGDPVVAGGVVYSASHSGKAAAFDLGNGTRLWTAAEGAMSGILPVADALFMVSDQGQLLRLESGSGNTVWAIDLPHETEVKDRRRRDIVAHYGPVLAGGRLVIASSDGALRAFDPASGALLASFALSGGAASRPAVAGGVLYVVTTDGQLHAFR